MKMSNPQDFINALQSDIAKNLSKLEIDWFEMKDPIKEHVKPIEFLVDGYIARGMITIIGGSAGSGKSILNQYLLSDHDNEVLNTTNDIVSVYLTGADSNDTEIRRRARAIGKNDGLRTVTLPHERFCVITNKDFYSDLQSYIIDHNVDCIIFDTLADFHNGNLYEAQIANATMSRFRTLAETTNAAIVLLTHTKKGSKTKTMYDVEDISDSRVFATKSDFVFGLRSEYQENVNLVELQCLKSRSERILPTVRMLISNDDDCLTISLTDQRYTVEQKTHEEQQQKNSLIQEARELQEKGCSQREIAKQLGLALGTVNGYVNMAKREK